ncbi:hypothetical protein GH866_22545 [Bacillus thuringiensis]|nr:hypothetical protein [Bacillus thuringiensis]
MESLTSNISCLAEEHNISKGTLINKILVPNMDKEYLIKCGKNIYDEYEGVTYSFAPTIKSLVESETRKSYDYHKVRPLSHFLVCLFCCNDKSKPLITTIVEMFEKFTKLKIAEGTIKEEVPKYVKKISPNIALEDYDNDFNVLPEYVIVTQIN